MDNKIKSIVQLLIAKHLDDPTHEMRVAFKKLPNAHKWLLFTILESGDRPSYHSAKEDVENLEKRFNLLCPTKKHIPFLVVLEELSEGFVQVIKQDGDITGVTWIHPSCQDLTMEELANSSEDRQRFLHLCTLDGLEKAVSVAGGSEGARLLPLLSTQADWECFRDRCIQLLDRQNRIVSLLISSLTLLSLSDKDPSSDKLKNLSKLIGSLWPVYLAKTDWTTLRSPVYLHYFLEMRLIAKASFKIPNLDQLWTEIVDQAMKVMNGDDAIEEASHTLSNFYRVADLLMRHESNFWKQSKTSRAYQKAIFSIKRRAETEIDSYPDYYNSDEKSLSEAAKVNLALSEIFRKIGNLSGVNDETYSVFTEAETYFSSHGQSLEDQASERSAPEYDRDEMFDAASEIDGREVTLEKLFEDL